jgi:hypothetical protein
MGLHWIDLSSTSMSADKASQPNYQIIKLSNYQIPAIKKPAVAGFNLSKSNTLECYSIQDLSLFMAFFSNCLIRSAETS